MKTFEQPQHALPSDTGREIPTVHLVDDDATVRNALCRLLLSHSYQVCTYASAEDFLACFDRNAPGCLLLDVSMPGMGGLELVRRLNATGDGPAAVFISGLADVSTCARALRSGAVHFLAKPVDEQELLQALEEAVRHDSVRRREQRHQAVVGARLASLTPREREVLEHVMHGRLNKQIASDLGTAEKTVKVHRARAMEKMETRSVAELVRMVERARPGRQDMEIRDWNTHGEAAAMPMAAMRANAEPARAEFAPERRSDA